MNGPERDARRAEIEAEFSAYSAEFDRAAERRAVARAIFEVSDVRTELAALRIQASSTVRRNALTEAIDRLDERRTKLNKEHEGLA